MNAVDMLDRALDGDEADLAPAVRALAALGREVAAAMAAELLDTADHDRIYARALAILGGAQRPALARSRLASLRRRAPVLIGGAAALTLGGAAIGWTVVHGRRSHRPVAA